MVTTAEPDEAHYRRVHEMRYATLKWVYENTHVARNGLRARRYSSKTHTDNVPRQHSRDDLMAVLAELDMWLEGCEDDESLLQEVHNHAVEHWGEKEHEELWMACLSRGLVIGSTMAGGNTAAFTGHVVFESIARRAEVEARQANVDSVVAQLADNDLAGAW